MGYIDNVWNLENRRSYRVEPKFHPPTASSVFKFGFLNTGGQWGATLELNQAKMTEEDLNLDSISGPGGLWLTWSSSRWRTCRGHRHSTHRWSAHCCCWWWRKRRLGWCRGRGPRLLAGTCPRFVCTGTSWWSSTPSDRPLLHGGEKKAQMDIHHS